jgi:TatA/E family protein of Tat protein translocase
MGPVGVQELIVIFLVALVLFGPKKLPELGKTIAKGISEFRRAQSELKSTFEGHMRDLEKEHESIKQVTASYTNDIYNTYNEYDSAYHDSGAVPADSSLSTEANPSTVGVTAPQVAESTVSHESPGNGTVPRPATSVITTEHAGAEPPPTPEHSVNS